MKSAKAARQSVKSQAGTGKAQAVQSLDSKSTLNARVRAHIDSSPSLVLVRSDFRALGSPSQLTRVLAALISEKSLVRIGHGLYAKTRVSSVTGQIIPAGSLETLATAALKRLGVEAGPGSAARAYNSGKTTQLPGFYVVNTGRRRIERTITVGGRTLIFEHD